MHNPVVGSFCPNNTKVYLADTHANTDVIAGKYIVDINHPTKYAYLFPTIE